MDERPFRSQYAPRQAVHTPVTGPIVPASELAKEPENKKSKPSPKEKGRAARVLSGARTHWWKVLIAIIVVGGAAFLLQNYFHTRNELKKLSDTKTAAQASDQQLLNEVKPYVVLPEGETPTVATVNDVSKLKDQVFFQNAQNGDKVLIFSQAKTAILYRPSVKKIVEYAPINVDANNTGTTTNTTPKKQ